jgi:ADP-ribosylglycohydrolase
MDVQNRFRGAMLGLAVGDAVGTTLEFKRPGSFAPITDMVGGGPFDLEPGQWTDDTSMALCLAESLVARQDFDAHDQMTRYVRWRRDGHMSCTGTCFDVGITVSEALGRFTRSGDPFAGSEDPHKAGNGSLMRLAPVPLFYAFEPEAAIERSGESSRTTHAAPTAVDACRYYAGLIVGALKGTSKAALLAPRYAPVPGYWETHALAPEVDAIAAGSFKHLDPPAIQGTGYVVRSLEAALWAFYHADSFEEGCLLAANLGDDADTTAAIYGQLAGTYYGADGIPMAWRETVAWGDRLTEMADALYELATSRQRAALESLG